VSGTYTANLKFDFILHEVKKAFEWLSAQERNEGNVNTAFSKQCLHCKIGDVDCRDFFILPCRPTPCRGAGSAGNCLLHANLLLSERPAVLRSKFFVFFSARRRVP
jgi:hypothetical protein